MLCGFSVMLQGVEDEHEPEAETVAGYQLVLTPAYTACTQSKVGEF